MCGAPRASAASLSSSTTSEEIRSEDFLRFPPFIGGGGGARGAPDPCDTAAGGGTRLSVADGGAGGGGTRLFTDDGGGMPLIVRFKSCNLCPRDDANDWILFIFCFSRFTGCFSRFTGWLRPRSLMIKVRKGTTC